MRRSKSSALSGVGSNGNAVPKLLRELHQLVHQIQDERIKNEHTLTNISKTHERMKSEAKVSSYFKSKLKGLYGAAIADCEAEAELIRKATDKIANIQALTNEGQGRNHVDGGSGLDIEPTRKPGMRRGVLMSILQQNAAQLPMFMGKASENVPSLCGSIPASSNHAPGPGDHVAARVRTPDGEEQWILAEVVAFNSSTNKYDIDDIDEEGGNKKERHHLSRRRFIPLPKMKVNPLTHKQALFQKQELVLALYPQTTCFYRALIHEPPSRPQDDYSVLFEDTSYPDGYSPPLCVPQRYVVTPKENKRR
ncbi:SAGA-associated factor 29-like [Xenia sp. Carnegie-2017]|uniref:SAGA-associated factor 29-like n=1 Tax=Xenia sp. Carnegie-2017 TaxID=2897299 RepID=UPI001F04B8F4|nr:SAGA-associated factor 29-like [Xenia sp. Carnegie-2017]